MIKLMSIRIKSPATFGLALSILVGLYALLRVTLVSGFVMDPKTMSCAISYHQSEYPRDLWGSGLIKSEHKLTSLSKL